MSKGLEEKVTKIDRRARAFDKALDSYASKYLGHDAKPDDVVEEIIHGAIGKARRGEVQHLKVLAPLILPDPSDENVLLPQILEATSTSGRFEAILTAVATAAIPASVADRLASLLVKGQQMTEVAEVLERLERLEESMQSEKGATGLGATKFAANR